MKLPRKHTVSKGETLIGIAKKYKHKTYKDIWNDADNAKLKKKRGKPEAIEPRDILVIPLTADEVKAFRLQRAVFTDLMMIERHLAEAMLERSNSAAKASELALKRYKAADKEFLAIIAMLKDCERQSKKWSDGVDAAAEVVKIMRGLGGLAKVGKEASKASGQALQELNKKAMGKAVDIAKDPLEGQAKKAATEYLLDESNEISIIGLTVGTFAEAFDKMQSPSFWAQTFVQISEGKGWSAAVTFDLKRDIENKVNQVDKERIFLTKRLLREAQDAAKASKEMMKQSSAALKRAEGLKKQIAEIPDV